MTPSTRLSTTAMRSAGTARRSENSSRSSTMGATGASMEKLRPRSPRIASHSQPKYCSYQGRSSPSCRRRVSNSSPVSDVQFRSRTSTASPGRTWRMTKISSETPTRVTARSHSRRIRYLNMGRGGRASGRRGRSGGGRFPRERGRLARLNHCASPAGSPLRAFGPGGRGAHAPGGGAGWKGGGPSAGCPFLASGQGGRDARAPGEFGLQPARLRRSWRFEECRHRRSTRAFREVGRSGAGRPRSDSEPDSPTSRPRCHADPRTGRGSACSS